MPFAGSTKAHRKARAPFRKAFLISRRNNRGIEERGGFHRILHRKVSADEQLARLTDRTRFRQKIMNSLVVLKKDVADTSMFFPEVRIYAL